MSGEPVDLYGDVPGRPKEAQRLEALKRFSFVDPEPGDVLDRFVRLGAQLFDTAFAALCFVESERVRFVARHGLGPMECPRTGTFFDETIRQDDILWIADARDVAPFRDSKLVTAPPAIRFYAGAPLKTPDGFAIGVLCVMDPDPRPLADLATRSALKDLAGCAMSEMECWRLNRELEAVTVKHGENIRELDLIFETAPIGLTLLDRDLRFQRINQRLADINGKPIEEHIGRTLHEVVPELAGSVERLLQQVLETGEPILDYEIVGETAKELGVERVWMESYYPIPEAAGRVGGVAVVVQEVTEERRVEARERDYAARLTRVLDGVAALVGLLDTDGTLIEANKMALSIAGLEPGDVLGIPFDQTYWWAYSPDVQAQLRDAMKRARGGDTVRYDVPVRVAGGRFITIDFQVAPVHDDHGRVINLVPSGVDITERKAAEAALQQSESLFRETFEQTAVGMSHVGVDGRWLRVNDRLCEIVGYPREALLGKTYLDITHSDDADADRQNKRRLLASEVDSYAMEKRYLRPDGSATWVNLTVSLRRNHAGEPDHFISVIEDISSRKKAEERLAVVMNELNHRVKNSLATIQSVVTRAARVPGSKRGFVQAVIGRIHAMSSAHDLLVRSQWQGAALSDLLEEELRPYGLHRVRIDGPDLWLIPNAALGVCLMVHELATNAAKYGALSRDEGHVSIVWTVADVNGERLLRFSWVERGGPAVAPPSTRGFGSEIIEQFAAKELDGTASSRFDAEGVRVSLDAPMAKVATHAPRGGKSEPRRDTMAAPPVSTSLRVLVVEDSALIAMDLASILADAGYTVIGPAFTVAEALAIADDGLVDIALLDIELHGEMVTPVAERLTDRGVPFAFSTGFEEGGSPLPVFTDAPVLRKPFDDQSVLSTLAALVATKSTYTNGD